MALNSMGLGFVFTARDMASAKFDRLTSKFNKLDTTTSAGAARMKGSLAQLKRGFAGFAVGAVGLLAAVKIAGPAGEFEQAIARVGAISRATASDLRLLEESATAAGLATQFSPREAAEGLGVLASQGFNAAESARALVPALDLAAGGGIGVADASKAMSSALKVFSLDVDDAALSADKLLRISNLTALQASDLSLALGTVGRGASATKQSLDEMLPAMGLVKNTGVDASVAASSVSSALLAMAKNADKFKQMGVSVTDAQGKFRPFLDVVLDTEKALAKYPNAAKRTEKAVELFSKFGLTAFSAISTQVGKGIKDARGNILKGTEAIDMLRDSMKNAGGAAKEFRDRLLDNFAGQKQLLSGIFDTLTIEAGKPFAAVLKPIVKGIAALLHGLIKVIQLIPGPVKKMVAGFLITLFTVGAIAGAAIAAKAAFALLGPMLMSTAVAMAPFILIALKVVAVFALVYAAISSVGRLLGVSMRDFRAVGAKLRLFWDGLTQVFSTGGFSGAVMKELNKAENEGIKNFVIQLFRIGSRIREFFRGIAAGFEKLAGPGFRALAKAGAELRKELSAIGDQIGGAVGGAGEALADFLPVGAKFNSAGSVIGVVLGAIVRGFVEVLIVGVKVFSFLASGIKHTIGFFREFISEAKNVGAHVSDAFSWMGDNLMAVFQMVRDGAKAMITPIIGIFEAMAAGIRRSLESIQDALVEALRQVPDWALPENLERLKATATTSEERRGAAAGEAQLGALPAAVQERFSASRGAAGGDPAAMVRALADLSGEIAALGEKQAAPTVVSLDGQKVGEILLRAAKEAAARAFSPVEVM